MSQHELQPTILPRNFILPLKEETGNRIVTISTDYLVGDKIGYGTRLVQSLDPKSYKTETEYYAAVNSKSTFRKHHRDLLKALGYLISPDEQGRFLSRKAIIRKIHDADNLTLHGIRTKIRSLVIEQLSPAPDKRQFQSIYELAAKSAQRLRSEIRACLDMELDEGARRMLETNEESRLATEPISQIKTALHSDPKTAYEGISLLIATLWGIPGIGVSENISNDGALFFQRFLRIFKSDQVIPFEIIATIERKTGKFLSWRPYDQTKKQVLKKCVPWRSSFDRLESFPYRTTNSGVKLSFDGTREKDEPDIIRKAIKSSKVADDIIAFRTQIITDPSTEDAEFIKKVGLVVTDMVKTFQTEPDCQILISTNSAEGLTQTFTEPIQIHLDSSHPQASRDGLITLAQTESINDCSNRSKIVQFDLLVTIGNRKFKVEWQIEPISGAIDRKNHDEIADRIYRMGQYFAPLANFTNTSLFTFFLPPYYAGNIRRYDFDSLRDSLISREKKQLRTDRKKVRLPNDRISITDRIRSWL